ncbi:MAG: ethanolamine utilization protein EutH [Anaeromassilibacillus sp.]
MNRYAVAYCLSALRPASPCAAVQPDGPGGKAANAAFAATGAFVFGGNGVCSSVSTGNVVAVMACKLVGGILAVWLAMHFTKDELPAERATNRRHCK